MGYQPTPTEYRNARRWARLIMSRDILLDYGPQRQDAPRLANVRNLARPSAVPMMSVRSFSSDAPRAIALAGASVCTQYRNPRLTRLASCSAAATASRAGRSMMLASLLVVAGPVEHRQVAGERPSSNCSLIN